VTVRGRTSSRVQSSDTTTVCGPVPITITPFTAAFRLKLHKLQLSTVDVEHAASFVAFGGQLYTL